MLDDFKPSRWMKATLLVAGVYNLLWGLVVVLLPETTLGWFGLADSVNYPQFWQCVGMIVGVYGIGYTLAARDPYRHWIIVLVGLLGKVFGPVGFLMNVWSGALPASIGWTILFNDLIWWIPFSVILWGALRHHQASATVHAVDFLDDDPIRDLVTTDGRSLQELSDERLQLIVFLRHTGCTFCREALAAISSQRKQIEETDTGIVLVHLGEDRNAGNFLTKYGLEDLPRISDPKCRLYRQFGLELGGFRQLFGPSVWVRGFKAGLLGGHGVGAATGNTFQMPGAFVLHCGRLVTGFQHEAASDTVDYLDLVYEARARESEALTLHAG